MIIPKEVWDRVQNLIESKKETNVRASSENPYNRYTGLLKCGDCGCTFVAKIRKWGDKPDRVNMSAMAITDTKATAHPTEFRKRTWMHLCIKNCQG